LHFESVRFDLRVEQGACVMDTGIAKLF
jgi:hypothetical protein